MSQNGQQWQTEIDSTKQGTGQKRRLKGFVSGDRIRGKGRRGTLEERKKLKQPRKTGNSAMIKRKHSPPGGSKKEPGSPNHRWQGGTNSLLYEPDSERRQA